MTLRWAGFYNDLIDGIRLLHFLSHFTTSFLPACQRILCSNTFVMYVVGRYPMRYHYSMPFPCPQRFYVPSSRQLRRNESTTRSPVYSHFGETIEGASSIRAYCVMDRFALESQQRVDVNNAFFYAFSSASRSGFWLFA